MLENVVFLLPSVPAGDRASPSAVNRSRSCAPRHSSHLSLPEPCARSILLDLLVIDGNAGLCGPVGVARNPAAEPLAVHVLAFDYEPARIPRDPQPLHLAARKGPLLYALAPAHDPRPDPLALLDTARSCRVPQGTSSRTLHSTYRSRWPFRRSTRRSSFTLPPSRCQCSPPRRGSREGSPTQASIY